MGGTVRGITRLFGGVPKRRDPGQRSMYVHNAEPLDPDANILIPARHHLLDLHRCMSQSLCSSPYCLLTAIL